MLSKWRVEPGAGGGGCSEKGSQEGWSSLKVKEELSVWGYTDGLGNLDVDVVGATDSLTGNVIIIMLIIIAVIVVVLVGC
jgi:hypothetical protein